MFIVRRQCFYTAFPSLQLCYDEDERQRRKMSRLVVTIAVLRSKQETRKAKRYSFDVYVR